MQDFGSLEGIYENLDQLKGKQLERIRDNKDSAFVSRLVATIVRDLDFPLDVESINFPSFDEDVVSKAFNAIRFNAHLKKVLALLDRNDPTRRQLDLGGDPVKHNEEALVLLDEALAAGERVGLSFEESDQISLFNASLTLAVSTSQGTAQLENEEALMALTRIIREGSFATLNVKRTVQYIYPPDTSLKAQI
ncbi:MAG: DNA polymerase I, partial [Raoultibacter sp.]